MLDRNKPSPLARENRPLPHEIQEFLEHMIYWQLDSHPQDLENVSVKHVYDWLKELAR